MSNTGKIRMGRIIYTNGKARLPKLVIDKEK